MTLTEAAYYLRKIIPIAVLGIIVIFILVITIKIAELAAPVHTDKPMPTPMPAYGQLPEIILPNAGKLPTDKTYSIETIRGVPETATSSARIYFIPKKAATLGFREKAAVLAKALNFDDKTMTTKLDHIPGSTANKTLNTYTIVDKNKRLVVDIDTENYTFTQDFDEETKGLLTDVTIPDEDTIKSKVRTIMDKLGRYPPDLAQGIQTISYITYKEASGSAQASADIVKDPQAANMVAVDFFPPNINDIQSVTEEYFGSPNRIVFIPKNTSSDYVLKAQVQVFERSEEQFSPYALRTGDQAYADLQAGKGFLIQGKEGLTNRTNIKIIKMTTAYLIPSTYTEYIQPVYVFIGDEGFVAYVPAVQNSLIQGLTDVTVTKIK